MMLAANPVAYATGRAATKTSHRQCVTSGVTRIQKHTCALPLCPTSTAALASKQQPSGTILIVWECPVCRHVGLTVKPYERWPPPAGQPLAPPYEDSLGKPSYEVCPRCGFEFGNDDNPGTAPPQSFEAYRLEWEAEGRPWFDQSVATDFQSGDHVVVIAEGPGRGDIGIVRWSRDGYSAINWIDEDPEEFGGSRVRNTDIRRCDPPS